MSSAVVSTSAALGRPFVFDDEAVPQMCPHLFSEGQPSLAQGGQQRAARTDSSLGKERLLRMTSIAPASHLNICPAPEMVSSGIAAIDALSGGLPRGCLTEICGPASSGRTTLLLAALAAATGRGEFCVVVDAGDALDPQSVAAAGVDLERLLWVRCGESSPQKKRSPQRHPSVSLSAGSGTEKKITQVLGPRTGFRNTNQSEHCLEQLLRATDMLLESGGFGLIALDLGDLPLQAARRIPLTTWFRFRRAVEHTPTILLTVEQQPIAGSCSSLVLRLESAGERIHAGSQLAKPAHAQLLTGLEITAELMRSRLERKPVRSASVAFASKTAWAG